MNQENADKIKLLNLGLICLSYSLLVTFLSYFVLKYNIDFLKNSFIFNLYFSLDNSFAGFLITGIWAFLDLFVLVTIFYLLYTFSEKIVSSVDKNA